MAERSRYADTKMPELREKVAEHKLVNDKGLPLKAIRKAVLVAALEEHDRKEQRKTSPRRQVVAARAASPLRKGREAPPAKTRSKPKQLLKAAREGNLDLVNRLIGAGDDVNAADSRGVTALMHAIRRGHREIVEMLIRAGAHVNAADYQGYTALMSAVAAYTPDMKIVGVLIREKANVNAANKYGMTALMLTGSGEIVEILIAAGANVNVVDKNGSTALMGAIRRGHREIVEILIAAKANVNAANNSGRTALMIAAWYIGSTQEEMVKILIAAGANVNAVDKKGNTALMAAGNGANMEVVKILIAAGANPEMQNNDGQTARDHYHSRKKEYDRTVEEFAPSRMIKAARQSPPRSSL